MEPTRRGLLSYLMGTGALLGMGAQALAAPQREGAERSGALRQLLTRNHGLRPEYGPGYSNHVSMGLYALSALGGSSQQLRAFADESWGPLEPLPKAAGPAVSRERFQSHLGQRAALNGYRNLFQREVSQQGRAATLERYLPQLLPGLGTAAFHPLIRTGYGVRFGDAREVADGLAYWATAYMPLGPLAAARSSTAGSEAEPGVLLQRLREARQGKDSGTGSGLVLERMREAANVPEFGPTVAALQPREDTLRKLAAAALQLYTLTDGDFTALHAVTGTHALRMLWPHVSQKELAVRYLWQALAAAYLTVGTPALSPAKPVAGEAPGWPQLVAKVLASTDEHDLKLVDVAREEGAFYQDAGYRRAAALRLRLL
jgi:hypothetical protein